MEGMKETEKKRNWKRLLVIPIIIVGIITLAYGLYVNNPGLQVVSTTTVHNTETTTPAMYTITGTKILDEQVTSDKIINLNAGRYSLMFQSDNNVIVSLKKSPNGFFVCCNNDSPKATGVYPFDVNSGAEGDYELKIDGDSHVSHVTISQTLAF